MQTTQLRIFVTLIAATGWCGLAVGQDFDGVVFMDDIETAAQSQAEGPQIPSLGNPSRPRFQSVPREFLQAANAQAEAQANGREEPSRSRFSGPFGWFRGDNRSDNQPASRPTNRKTPLLNFDRNVRPASVGNRPNQTSGLSLRDPRRDNQQGLLGSLFKSDGDDKAKATQPSGVAKSASGRSRGKPTPISSLASRFSRSKPEATPQALPSPSYLQSENTYFAPGVATPGMPLPLANPAAGGEPSFDASDITWVDESVPAQPAIAAVEPVVEEQPQPAQSQPAMQIQMPVETQLPVQTQAPVQPEMLAQPQPGNAESMEEPRSIQNPYAVANRPSRKQPTTPRPVPTSQPATPVVQPVTVEPVKTVELEPKPEPTKVAVVENPVIPDPTEETEQKPSQRASDLLRQANSIAQTAGTEEEFTQVVQMCRHVLAIDSTPVAVKYGKNLASWALNRRGELKADEAREDEALIDFDDALRLDAECWRAVHNRGVLRAQGGNFAHAFDDFNTTISINPKFSKAYSNRAALYVQSGHLNEALEDYKQAIALDPDLAIAHKGRGRVCHLLGEFEASLRHFDAAMSLAPTDAFIAINRADLLVDMGRYHQAVDCYKNAIAIDGNLPAAHRGLSWLLATCPSSECRNAQQALASAERARALLDSDDDFTLDTLAAAKANAGDFTAAVELQRQALELARETDQASFEERLKLYERQLPYRTEPASDVQQATYVD